MAEPNKMWIPMWLSNGKLIDLISLDNKEFMLQVWDAVMIAHSLACTNRFSGHAKFPYSVAQHSVYVAMSLTPYNSPKLTLAGLLHDASEAFFGDIHGPMKHFPDFIPNLVTLDEAAQDNIWAIHGLNLSSTERDLVKEFDSRILSTEVLQLFNSPTEDEFWKDWFRKHPPVLPGRYSGGHTLLVNELNWKEAKAHWLRLYNETVKDFKELPAVLIK